MSDRPYNVLFLCKANSARSIMAESLLRHWGIGRFKAFSAGSEPLGSVQPDVLDLLKIFKMPTEGLASKGWEAFTTAEAPELDFVFTVCEETELMMLPRWRGSPITAHWPVIDPLKVEDDAVMRNLAFREAFRALETRIKIFSALRLDSLNKLALDRELGAIGRNDAAREGTVG